jgi:hypothetical protein
MPDLAPNRLVAELARGLSQTLPTLQASDDSDMALANSLANESHVPELVTFAGFLGGTLEYTAGRETTKWRLLYLDAKLVTWLLVRESEIVQRASVEDRRTPFGGRDVIWIAADTSVSRGSGAPQPEEVQARYLRGDFTRAGDFAATINSGTFSSPTGVFCEHPTPGCCGRRTR